MSDNSVTLISFDGRLRVKLYNTIHWLLPAFPRVTSQLRLRPFQRWIKDFPDGEGRQPQRGAPTYCLANFSQKLHENEEILGRGGGGVASLTLYNLQLQCLLLLMGCIGTCEVDAVTHCEYVHWVLYNPFAVIREIAAAIAQFYQAIRAPSHCAMFLGCDCNSSYCNKWVI